MLLTNGQVRGGYNFRNQGEPILLSSQFSRNARISGLKPLFAGM